MIVKKWTVRAWLLISFLVVWALPMTTVGWAIQATIWAIHMAAQVG